MPWPGPVERVAVFLREAGAESRLEELSSPTPTATAAAEVVGCSLEQIVKSLVVVCDGSPVLALVPGDRRADLGKVLTCVGANEVRVARPEEVVAVTGFAPGGVSPFPPPPRARVLVDRRILGHPSVWVGAGSEMHLAMVAPAELLRLTRGTTVDLAAESA